jgi:hypothetical protein
MRFFSWNFYPNDLSTEQENGTLSFNKNIKEFDDLTKNLNKLECLSFKAFKHNDRLERPVSNKHSSLFESSDYQLKIKWPK